MSRNFLFFITVLITNIVWRDVHVAAFLVASHAKPLTKARFGHVMEVASRRRTGSNSYDDDGASSFRVVRCFPHLSRREAERAIAEGRVRVNGNTIQPSCRLAGGDTLTLDNRKIQWEARARAMENRDDSRRHPGTAHQQKETSPQEHLVYYKYHKPIGVTCTMDKYDRRGLYYSLPSELRRKGQRLFPIGRLDLESQGLVLLTNDGRLADAMLQPRNKQEKEYIVAVRPPLSPENIADLETGVVIRTVQQRGGQEKNEKTKPCTVQALKDTGRTHHHQHHAGDVQELRFVLCEGRNRQIRKMVDKVGSQVVSLARVRHGIVDLGKLPSGAAAAIGGGDLERLLEAKRKIQRNTGGKRKRHTRR